MVAAPRAHVLLLAASLLVACSKTTPQTTSASSEVASNVLRSDYAGSTACEDCHAEIYAAWKASPMRNMTRDAATAQVRAPFTGGSLTVGTDTATMTMSGRDRIITHAAPEGTTSYRVTKIIGGRYREDFVGVDTALAAGPERVLPVTWVFSTQSWRYKGYSVMVKDRPAMSARGLWAEECIPCHNTLPQATLLYDELYGDGIPAYQGRLADRLLPKSKLWSVRSLDDPRLTDALGREIEFLGGRRPQAQGLRPMLVHAAATTNDLLKGDKLVELGIGCEACHNGARAHAADPTVRPSYASRSDVLAVAPPANHAGTRAQWINHTCAKCHTVLFSRYAYTWEGGQRTKNPGGSTTNSGEGRDFLLGGCATQMACTTCHDPHAEDPKSKLAALATKATGDATCVACHPKAGSDGHAHHTSVSCVDCHMPKKNMGLDYALVRYHRIGSPNDRARVEHDRPVECALCHRDKSVASLVATMETWWPKTTFDRAALERLYASRLDQNALRAALLGLPHEQAVAIAVLGEARDATALPALARHLWHDYPLVRFYAGRAIERITGAPVTIDLNQSAAAIEAAWKSQER